ncbi:MAG: type II methionyl aminopeptidase, partial [Thermoplasmata archaeon]
VRNGPNAYIFRFVKRRSLKRQSSKRLLKFIEGKFRTLPFAERWLLRYFPREKYYSAFLDLLSSKALMAYPVFLEASGGVVAQAEHTILVSHDGAIILT